MKKIALTLILLLFSGITAAQDIQVGLEVSTTVLEVGESAELDLVFKGVSDLPAPQLNTINGFNCQYAGPATQISIVNGSYSKTLTYRYQLIPLKAGTFKIGPFSFSHKGDTYSTSAVEVTVGGQNQRVTSSNQSQSQSQGTAPNESDLKEYVFLTLSAKKTKAFVNERIPVIVKLYVRQLQINGIQSLALNGQGFVKEDFSKPRQYRETLNGVEYAVVEFTASLYAVNAGQLAIGPAEMDCTVLVTARRQRRSNSFFNDSFFDDFFGGAENRSLKLTSKKLSLPIQTLPNEGKPRDFTGVVGVFSLKAAYSQQTVKAGDPLTLRMEVSGEGNFDSVTSPVLVNTEGFKLYKPETKSSQNAKSFEQVIIPQTSGVQKTPAMRFVYFNPETQKYVALEKAGIEIAVSQSDEKGAKLIDSTGTQSAVVANRADDLGSDIEFIKEEPGVFKKKGIFLYQNKMFWLLQSLPVMFFLMAFMVNRKRERWQTDQVYAGKKRAPKIARAGLKEARNYLRHNNAVEFYNTIFKTLQEYLGYRFSRPSAGMIADIVEELAVKDGLDPLIAEKLRGCFADCDMARYASARIDQQAMTKTIENLEEIIGYLEKKK